MSAIAQAYASNNGTPLDTFEFSHSSITTRYYVQGYYDLTATLEDMSSVTFLKSGIRWRRPERSTEGKQDLVIQIDNVSNELYNVISTIQDSMRTTTEKAVIKYRPYLITDLSAPAGAVIRLYMTGASINRNQGTINASWTPLPDVIYPRYRYYPTIYPGVKYQ